MMNLDTPQRTALSDLIGVQSQLQAIRHEIENSSLREQLTELMAAHKQLSARRAEAEAALQQVTEQAALSETELAKLTALIERKTAELNAGSGLTSRDLLTLQHEIDGHHAKKAELEDAELTLMEQVENQQSDVAQLSAELEQIAVNGRQTQQALKDRIAELNDQSAQLTAEKEQHTAALPAELVSRFEANVANGGPGAAILRGPICLACGQELPGVAWREMTSADINDVFACPECEAVLIRAD